MSDLIRYKEEEVRLHKDLEERASRLALREWLEELEALGANLKAIPRALEAATKFHRLCGTPDLRAREKAWEDLLWFVDQLKKPR